MFLQHLKWGFERGRKSNMTRPTADSPPARRFGPRQIRTESALLRAYNSGTRAAPYESLVVADIGDVNVNLYDLKDTCKRIREAYRKILSAGCIPLTMGKRATQGSEPIPCCGTANHS